MSVWHFSKEFSGCSLIRDTWNQNEYSYSVYVMK